jgi:hypothetical protein
VAKRFEHAAGSFSVRLRLTKSLMGELRRRGSLNARITTSTEDRGLRTVRHARSITLVP